MEIDNMKESNCIFYNNPCDVNGCDGIVKNHPDCDVATETYPRDL